MGIRQVGEGFKPGFTVTIICLACGSSETDEYISEEGTYIIYRCMNCNNIARESR
jgi:uncharacterized Zn finger protein